jgi:hypothetical protein
LDLLMSTHYSFRYAYRGWWAWWWPKPLGVVRGFGGSTA